MSDDAQAVPGQTGSRTLFWITAALAFVLVFSVLLPAPRGIATGDEVTGTDVEVELEDLSDQTTDTPHTAYLAPGEQATTDFTFRYGRPCGEFVAWISCHLTLDESESSHVDVPLTVGAEQCLAGR